MLVGRQNLERVLVVRVAPAHARDRERVAYERIDEEIRVCGGQSRESLRMIVELVANGSANPPPTKAMGEQQDVSAAEVIESLDLLTDSWRNVLTFAGLP